MNQDEASAGSARGEVAEEHTIRWCGAGPATGWNPRRYLACGVPACAGTTGDARMRKAVGGEATNL